MIFYFMAFESDKIMFEIYRDTLYNKKYRVVYFTELNEHKKIIKKMKLKK